MFYPCFVLGSWLRKPMFFEEKLDVLLLPEPKKPGVKTWPKAHRKAARNAGLYSRRGSGSRCFCCGKVRLYRSFP
jgi:hypothetical protein